ncbi:MAG TPA: carbohydrate ABC transporter permease [Anaerolineales bacterium]|nr:carbohydrate ABC transporter permease [Anaerolineales bacterium]
MISTRYRPIQPAPVQKIARPSRMRRFVNRVSYNLFAWVILVIYLLPVAYMVVTAFKPTDQLSDNKAPWYPSKVATYTYLNHDFQLYHVPTGQGMLELALVNPGVGRSEFIDPQDPTARVIEWKGDWKSLQPYYVTDLAWGNFTKLFTSLPFPTMLANTFLLVMIGEIGVLVSSILVAYGFSRFPLPGGELLFYVLIATILIPEKVTFIPTFFFYVKVLNWQGTIYPLVVNLFFGNAVYIFLLRQNFRSLPLDQEESAMLDGAGPLRRLFSVVLPQSWPAVVTISLLQFFYAWNETRLASLYLGTNSKFMPVSFAVQTYQSLVPIQNMIEAGSVIILVIPVIILILSQRFFMRSMVITGMEKR